MDTLRTVDTNSNLALHDIEKFFPGIPLAIFGSVVWAQCVDLHGFSIRPNDIDLATSFAHADSICRILGEKNISYQKEEDLVENKGIQHISFELHGKPVSIFCYPENAGIVPIRNYPQSGLSTISIQELIRQTLMVAIIEANEAENIGVVLQKRIVEIYVALAQENFLPPFFPSTPSRIGRMVKDAVADALGSVAAIYQRFNDSTVIDQLSDRVGNPQAMVAFVQNATETRTIPVCESTVERLEKQWKLLTGNVHHILEAVPELRGDLERGDSRTLSAIERRKFPDILLSIKSFALHDGTSDNHYHKAHSHGRDVAGVMRMDSSPSIKSIRHIHMGEMLREQLPKLVSKILLILHNSKYKKLLHTYTIFFILEKLFWEQIGR